MPQVGIAITKMTTREANEIVEFIVYMVLMLVIASILHVDSGLNYLYSDPDNASGYAPNQTLNY